VIHSVYSSMVWHILTEQCVEKPEQFIQYQYPKKIRKLNTMHKIRINFLERNFMNLLNFIGFKIQMASSLSFRSSHSWAS
jgi:hypothetical protein